jgi:hypothetical protein
VLGHQRVEKGYSLVPAVAQRILKQRGDVRILVHNAYPEQMPDAHRAVRALASTEPRLVLDERAVDSSVWAQLFESSDVILCPYNPNAFRARPSAIAWEALANGLPLVVPAGTHMEAWMREFGDCGAAFGQFEPHSIAAAIISVIDEFNRYASAAYAAAKRWRTRYGPSHFVDALLAFS